MVEQKSRELLYFKTPVFVVDMLVHVGALLFLLHVLPDSALHDICADGIDHGVFAALVLSFSVSIGIIGLRLHERKIKPLVVIWRAVLQTIATYVFFIAVIAVVYKVVPRTIIGYQIGITLPVIVLSHYLMNKFVRVMRRLGHNTRNVVIIGADEVSARLCHELGYGQAFTGYKVLGFFSTLDSHAMPQEVENLGAVHEFYTWVENNHPDEIYCSLPPDKCSKDVNKIIQICNDKFIEFFFVPNMDGYPKRQMNISNMGKVPIIALREEPLNNVFAKIYKRTFDIVVSGLFLCTLYPLVHIAVMIGTKLTSPGPIFFRQERTGYNGESFRIFKFRSMKVNVDADKLQATKDDPRKTKFGDFLRKSSIDELPQFINVFLGDMSIIGPRPHMEFHTEMYSSLISDYMVRHLAKPGITGWAQINGCRGETKTVEEMADRVEHDIWYIEHWTPLLDIEIFFKTIWQVIPGHDKQAY